MAVIDRPDGADTRVVHTACTLDCPDLCSLAVTVTDGRIVDIDAGPHNPLTDGWICSKVKRHAKRVYAPERVMTPLVRTGPKGAGEFRPASWDEAVAIIAGRMREAIDASGPDAVVAFTYNSSAARIEQDSMTEAFFHAIGATHIEHTICAHTIGESWSSVFGRMASADPTAVVDSELVVIWGANPTVSNTHFPPLVRQAVQRGAKVVVIDPRRTAMAARADLHLAVRPGTDVVLAYAIAHQWIRHGHIDHDFIAQHATGADEFLAAAGEWSPERAAEVTGLTAADVVTLAQWWGTSPAALLRIGWGQERNANGGAACRSILSLPVVGGHFGRPGTGVVGSVRAGGVSSRRRWPDEARQGPARRTLPLHQVGRWMAPDSDDPCRVLFVQGSNPLVMCPDQAAVQRAFERDDVFTVVHEQVLTDTTRYADIVLPATTSFEIDDFGSSYGSTMLIPVVAVIDRVGESRSNDETGLALAHAMGFDWTPGVPHEATDDIGPRQVDVRSQQFVDTFPGASHGDKARLVDEVAGVPAYQPVAHDHGAFPLTLISPATSKLVNSMFGEFQSPEPTILLHPDDAAARGLSTGARARVTSAAGRIEVPVDVNDSVRPGVAVLSKGSWLRAYAEGLGVNALTPDTGDPTTNGACFNDTFVEVAPA